MRIRYRLPPDPLMACIEKDLGGAVGLLEASSHSESGIPVFETGVSVFETRGQCPLQSSMADFSVIK